MISSPLIASLMLPKEKIINGVRIFRVRGVAGGDRIKYTNVVFSSTGSLQLVKTLLHSVVSDNAESMAIDIDDFFILSTLSRAEYIRIPVPILRKKNSSTT